MSRQATFDAARAAFVPAADDNPDCVPFYRTHAGLVAAWGADFRRAKHNPAEQARIDALRRSSAAICDTCGKTFTSGEVALTHECINDHRVRPIVARKEER